MCKETQIMRSLKLRQFKIDFLKFFQTFLSSYESTFLFFFIIWIDVKRNKKENVCEINQTIIFILVHNPPLLTLAHSCKRNFAFVTWRTWYGLRLHLPFIFINGEDLYPLNTRLSNRKSIIDYASLGYDVFFQIPL